MTYNIFQRILSWPTAIADRLLNRNAKPRQEKSERQKLVDMIYMSFLESQWDKTTDEGLLFNTCFHIYVNEETYYRQEQTFSFTAKDVMNKINRHIKKVIRNYPDYTPHSNYWLFQFSPLNADGKLDPSLFKQNPEQGPEKDEIPIISTLYALEDNHYRDSSQRVVATVHSKDSFSIRNWNINLNALRDVEITGTSLFRFKFTLDGTTSQISAETRRNRNLNGNPLAVATLRAEGGRFIDNGQTTSSFDMTSDKLYVYGKLGEPDTGGKEIARLDSDEVLSPHVILKRTPQGSFEVQAKGETVLNEVPLPYREDSWTPLPNNSTLLINGKIQLRFLIPHHSH